MANGLGSILGRALAGGQAFQQAGTREIELQQAEQTEALRRAALGQPIAQPAQPLSLAPLSPGAELVARQPELTRDQAMAQIALANPQAFEDINKSLGLRTQTQRDEAADFTFRLERAPFEQRSQLINERIVSLESQGRDASDTKQLIGLPQDQQDQIAQTVQLASLSVKEMADLAAVRVKGGI